MAVQRYLSTRNVKAARRALLIALSSDILINVFLAVLGFALLAYFRANPQLLADGQTIVRNPDQLFPRFILLGIPHGISGLVFVALLAAAMGSLSSGINSSCSVITVDFIERFRKGEASQAAQVSRAKWVSVFIGIIVVLLSFLINQVKGNLLEVAFKVVNLLVAPLFGLFVMAMFVRWATVVGTLIGTAGGLSVVVGISYWEEITGQRGISFIWAMPLGLLTQVALGMSVSGFSKRKRAGAPSVER
jgi:SSS family solute:Na+ symporter